MKLTNEIVLEVASKLGFDLVGFAEYDLLTCETHKLKEWLNSGFHAGMTYMERNFEKRNDVRLILPNAKSVLSLGMNYFTNNQHTPNSEGKISRYAWGKDYHDIMWQKLDQFILELQKIDPEFEAKSYVDTGPVMDKAWAVRAGLGWQGKHSNIINKKIGSWFFLATVITNYEFESSPHVPNFCGTCTACIDACPTQAIVQDYVVDANRCISYLTIENKGDIDPQFKNKFDNWVFGCDICQDVCPWNKKFSNETNESAFQPFGGKTSVNLDEAAAMDENEFKNQWSGTPLMRTKLKGLRRNAKFLKAGESSQ